MARFEATGISPRLSAPPLFHLWRAQGETCRSRYHTRARARLLETTGNLFPASPRLHRKYGNSFSFNGNDAGHFFGFIFRVCLNEENNRPHASGHHEKISGLFFFKPTFFLVVDSSSIVILSQEDFRI
jgi:hypothetical protein